MRILLTGGAGFIGSNLAEKLLSNGYELAIVDNFCDFYDPNLKEKNLREVRGKGEFLLFREDIRDRDMIRHVFEEFQPERVIHLAAMAGVRPSLEEPALYCETNVTGTVNLLEAARQFGVEQFVFGSSSSVYGANEKVPFHEEDPLDNVLSPYAATKLAGEKLCSVYARNDRLPITCLRFFTVYGPRQRPEMAIHKFVRMIRAGEKIPVYHRGKSARDYTYVDDIVDGILAALDRVEPFEIYNLGNSAVVKLLDLVKEIETAIGEKADIRLMPQQAGDVPITFADISKARADLGFEPKVEIREGIRRFVRWQEQFC